MINTVPSASVFAETETNREIEIPVQLTKEFNIQEIRAAKVSVVPFRIFLEDKRVCARRKSSLWLDEGTCARHRIPLSLGLVGRILVCVFESREPPRKSEDGEGQVDTKTLRSDDLLIRSLKKIEAVSHSFGTIPPSKHSEVWRTLKLVSFDQNAGAHLHPIPCPFYEFVLELSEEEYEACKALPGNTVFNVSFRLA